MPRHRDNDISPGLLAFAAGFCLIFLIGGSALLWAGHSQRRLAKASLEWPWVTGEVQQFQIGPKPEKGAPNVKMLYTYTVRGREFHGYKILFGSYNHSDVSRWSQEFSAGATPRVFFQPDHPEVAVLEPGRVYGTWIITIFGGVFAITGLLIARWVVTALRSLRLPLPGRK